MKTLAGRVAVVTGGASGIGYAIAHRLLSEGMSVVIADVEASALEPAVASLSAHGPVMGHVCDVSDYESVSALAAAAVDRFGAVHLLCNNAGVESGGRIEDVAPEIWRWVLSVNFGGVLNGCRAFLPLLREHEESHIVNMSSMAGLIGAAPATGPYAISKASVIALSETLDAELRDEGASVGVSVVVPGSVRTRFHDSERNRPARVPASAGGELRERVLAGIAKRQERAISPDQVAAGVVDGIRNELLYIVTHPEMTEQMVRQRADAIIASAQAVAGAQVKA